MTPVSQKSLVGRSSDLDTERLLVDQAEFVSTLMEAMPTPAMILNEHRQILAVNERLIKALDLGENESLIGLRPGEMLGCIHHQEGIDGCGTAKNCSVCGALLAIVARLESDSQISGECRLTLWENNRALDLEATASPLNIGGKSFTVLVLRDISEEKRKQVMERTFFHDIINTAGGIRGLAAMLQEEHENVRRGQSDYSSLMVTLSDNLVEEIKHHRRLLAAEKGEFSPNLEEIDLRQLLKEVCDLYGHHERVPGRSISLSAGESCRLRTDPPVLRRIIGNMLLNAMEACGKGQAVEVRLEELNGAVRIAVTNPGEISPEVQMQIFQRSFSSKGGAGRGIGTYSMKLFGERYLGGKVGFYSKEAFTTFFISLPR